MVCEASSCPAASSACHSARCCARSADVPVRKNVPGSPWAASWRAACKRWLATASSYVKLTAARFSLGHGKADPTPERAGADSPRSGPGGGAAMLTCSLRRRACRGLRLGVVGCARGAAGGGLARAVEHRDLLLEHAEHLLLLCFFHVEL